MRKAVLFALLAISPAATAYENSLVPQAPDPATYCTPVRLDEERVPMTAPTGRSYDAVPTLPHERQAGNTCASHTAAYLYNFAVERHDPHRRGRASLASPYEVAIRYALERDVDLMEEGGFISPGIEQLLQHGHCDAGEFESRLRALFGYRSDDRAFTVGKLMTLLHRIRNEYRERRQSARAGQSEETLLRAACVNVHAPLQLSETFPTSQLLPMLGAETPEDLYRWLLSEACPPEARRRPSLSRVHFYGEYQTDRQILDRIHRIFSAGRDRHRPIGLAYCSAVVLGERRSAMEHRQVNFLGRVRRPRSPQFCGGHASAVIGRRLHQGRCQLLVQDWYGERCGTGTSFHWECEPGHSRYWIDEDVLASSTLSITFFED